MAKTRQPNEKTEQVQVKIARSQAKEARIMAVTAIIISILSLGIAYLTFHKDNEEVCTIRINMVEEEYLTDISTIISCCDSAGIADTSGSVLLNYNSEIINLSKNSITIVSYYLCNNMDSVNLKLDNINWKKLYEDKKRFYMAKMPLQKAVTIAPGESYILSFKKYQSFDKKLFKRIRHLFKKIVTVSDMFYISDVFFVFYLHNLDFFGNYVDCKFDEENQLKSSVYNFKKLKNNHYYFVIETAKGNYFAKKVSWYSEDHNLPFLNLLSDQPLDLEPYKYE